MQICPVGSLWDCAAAAWGRAGDSLFPQQQLGPGAKLAVSKEKRAVSPCWRSKCTAGI